MKLIYKLADGTIIEVVEEDIKEIRIASNKSPNIEASCEDSFLMVLSKK